jgi:DNA repair protein RecN (Recombination protein N)
MLSTLHVRNYALIRHLEIDFRRGLTIITGETGAGKSILLGALGLLLGNRADTSVLMDKDKKCFVEGSFRIGSYGLEDFFRENDLDYEDPVILRREIAPGGKSRAFINDTPVNLPLVRELGIRLVDIHSQHHNLNLSDHRFQLTVVDNVAGNRELLAEYREKFGEYTELGSRLAELRDKARQARADLDYLTFQFNQLEEAKLSGNEQESLEQEIQTLDHAEEIKRNLLTAHSLIDGEEGSVRDLLKRAMQAFAAIRNYYPVAGELAERIESAWIELKDIAGQSESDGTGMELDPARQQLVRERLDLLYSLMQKHGVKDLEALIRIRDELDARISDISSYDEQIGGLEKQWSACLASLESLSARLSAARKKILPGIEKEVIAMLRDLGIPNATFRISARELEHFTGNGRDEVEFLFSANKQVPPWEISRVASGGELSRLMLSIKSLLSESLELPTIIFDEVDSGVSGEIADKVGSIMKKMARGKQIINITHLPQVAGKGEHHYLVYKSDSEGGERTGIRLLNDEERVLEIARMLSGEELTEAAISNARELLN